MGYRGSGGGYGSGSYSIGYANGPSMYSWGRIAGGTGYIGNLRLKNGVMYCYDCGDNSTASTKTVQYPEVSDEPVEHYSKIGNGYAIVRYIGEFTQS